MTEKEIIKYFNIILLSDKDDKFFNIYECLVPLHLKCDTKKEREYFNDLVEEIGDFAKRRNYFQQFKNGSFALTSKGEKAKRKGGHYELEKHESDKESKEDEILNLEGKLKKFELKIGNRIIINSLIITLLNFVITISTIKFWEFDKNNSRQEIQVSKPINLKNNGISKDSLN